MTSRWLLIVLTLVTGMTTQRTIIAQDAATPDGVEILWDTWGVPHIFSPDNAGVFYGFGWAQAQLHGDLLLELYGTARGRGAEYWGEEYLDETRLIHTLGIPQLAQAAYDDVSDEFREYLIAFTDGINDYAAQNPDLIRDDVKAVLPVTPTDAISLMIYALRFQFVAGDGIDYAMGWENDDPGGSNAWAIAPSMSTSGNAMLVLNPHQPWYGLGMWVEAHFITPELNLYGAALVGGMTFGVGFNPYLGWTHTVNTHDGWDLYQLTLTDDGGYLFDGETRAFDTREETILVKGADGEMTEVPLTVRESIHGQVLAEREDGTALALRVVGDNGYDPAIQWWEMGNATNFDEFQAAVSNIRIPMFTVMYADRDGNIMHLFNELIPVREEGDWAFWNNTTRLSQADGSAQPAIIPGDTSRYVWTEYHPYDDLPKVINPASGWLQNANEPPSTTTYPLALNPDDYPAYMLPDSYVWPRPSSSIRLLSELQGPITFDQLVELKHSTFSELTNQILDDLIAAARENGSDTLLQAADVIENWDRHMDKDSVGAALFTAWIISYLNAQGVDIYAVQWDINDPLNTPRGLADPDGAARTLETVAAQLEALRALGAGMDVPYGDVFRVRVGNYDLPANGGVDLVGAFYTLNFSQDRDLRFRAEYGESFIGVVEFSDPIRAQVLLTHGNATQPDSPHFGDQLQLLTEKRLREAWLTREEIEAHLEDRMVFNR